MERWSGTLNIFTMSEWRRLRIVAFVSHVEKASRKQQKGHNN
jgi:hypothetical protein